MESDATRRGYDAVAPEYAARMAGELEQKPLDRELLDRFAAAVTGRGTVCDLGCGPGHIARYLHDRGIAVVGVDLSDGMVEQARRLNPAIKFQQGDMRDLDVPDAAWAGIVAFYSLIHIPRATLPVVLGEIRRVLCPGGPLLVAFHIGTETAHVEDWFGQAVSLDFAFFEPAEMEGHLRLAGFVVVERVERAPYEGFEVATRRAYILARRSD